MDKAVPSPLNDRSIDRDPTFVGVVDGQIKWFDRRRGYGFVVATSEAYANLGDIFIHVSTLAEFDIDTVSDGALVCGEVHQALRGPAMLRLIRLEAPISPAPKSDLQDTGKLPERDDLGLYGPTIVKWFDLHKGYGFLKSEQVPVDIFLPIWVIKRRGLTAVRPGDHFLTKVITTERGLSAADILPIGEILPH